MKRLLVSLLLLCVFAAVALAQGRRDALTIPETDQLRDTAQEPDKRIRLFVKFAQARMLAIDQLRSDPNMAEGRGKKLHDLIDDLTNILDEMGDNMESYNSRKYDIRKSLKDAIEAMSDMQLKVRALKQASEQGNTAEVREYEFALENLVEAVNTNADIARQLLDDQNAAVAAAKEAEKQEKERLKQERKKR